MLFNNPRVLPALLLCVGLALAGLRWWELRSIPALTEAQLEVSVELNYALDLAREGIDTALPADETRARKDSIRAELRAETIDKRDRTETEMRQGILMVLIGATLYIIVMTLQQRGILGRTR